MDSLASSNGANSRNYSFTRRREVQGRWCRNLFDIGVWILIELVVILSLIASTVVLSSSRHEKPRALLFVWVIGYASGCVATFPLLYWRFLHCNQGTEQDSTQTRQDASQNNPSSVAISVLQSTDEEDRQTAVSSARSAQSVRARADLNHTRGAATENIIVLPTYKFKLKDRNGDDRDTNSEGVGESGGTLEAGTEKERIITGEGAECSICLQKYADNEELKEFPCAHFFHVDCVDKWLKTKFSCPLCKCDIRQTSGNLHTSAVPSATE